MLFMKPAMNVWEVNAWKINTWETNGREDKSLHLINN